MNKHVRNSVHFDVLARSSRTHSMLFSPFFSRCRHTGCGCQWYVVVVDTTIGIFYLLTDECFGAHWTDNESNGVFEHGQRIFMAGTCDAATFSSVSSSFLAFRTCNLLLANTFLIRRRSLQRLSYSHFQ